MKTAKILILTVVFVLIATSLVGCFGPSEKVFSKAGMSITLDSGFNEKEYVSYTVCYDSKNVAIFVLKEEFSLFESADIDAAALSLNDYAELVIANNSVDADVQTKDGLTYFKYNNSANGKEYTYSSYVYKTDDAFWLIQFATEQDEFEQNAARIEGFAKSVKFD